jgi:hypothetical protein
MTSIFLIATAIAAIESQLTKQFTCIDSLSCGACSSVSALPLPSFPHHPGSASTHHHAARQSNSSIESIKEQIYHLQQELNAINIQLAHVDPNNKSPETIEKQIQKNLFEMKIGNLEHELKKKQSLHKELYRQTPIVTTIQHHQFNRPSLLHAPSNGPLQTLTSRHDYHPHNKVAAAPDAKDDDRNQRLHSHSTSPLHSPRRHTGGPQADQAGTSRTIHKSASPTRGAHQSAQQSRNTVRENERLHSEHDDQHSKESNDMISKLSKHGL